VFGISVFGKDITERKRAEEDVRALSQEVIVAREEERRRVSSALHHDVGSLAVGLSATLEAIQEDLASGKPREAVKHVKQARKVFDESVAGLKELAVQLWPPELDILGLCSALRQHFSRVTQQQSVKIHLRESLGRRRVRGEAATILFRIAQEAVTNAISHGGAKRVDVRLSASAKKIRLAVRDNGKGFDPTQEPASAVSGMGLRVMKQMVVSAGGAITIDSGPRKGTTLRMSLPFEAAASAPGGATPRVKTGPRGRAPRSAGRGSQPPRRSGA
jgi:two-component system NarL family sensor kinase